MAITKVSTGLIEAGAASVNLNIDENTLYIDVSTNRVGIGTQSPDTKLHLSDGGTPELRLESTDASVVSGQSLGDITWESNDVSGGGQGVRAKISALAENAGTIYGLAFYTGTGADPTEKVRITNTGNVGIGTASPGALADIYDSASASSNDLLHVRDYLGGGSDKTRLIVKNGGNVGIGTASPGVALDINRATSTASYARVGNGGNVQAYMGVAGDNLPVLGTYTNHPLRININTLEVARVDTSGNLLVGTTDTTPWDNSTATVADDGIFLGGGRLGLAKWGGVPLLVNRTDSDGEIAIFYKDGSPVGSIGTDTNKFLFTAPTGSNTVALGATTATGETAGLYMYHTTNSIIPFKSSDNTLPDDTISLGYSSGGTNYRFKDLWLSGGVRGTSTLDITIPETSGGAIQLEFGNNVNTTRRTVRAYKDNFEPVDADTGVISLGQAANKWKDLYLSGGVKQSTVLVSALPAAASSTGYRFMVSDSTVAASGNFGATVAGSGSNVVPVFSDGTNWLIG